MKILQIIRFVIYSNIFVSLCAAAFVSVSRIILNLPLSDFYAEAAVFFTTLAAYNFQRVINPLRNGIPLTERQQWMQEHKNLLIALIIISVSAAGAVYIFLLNHHFLLLFILIPAAIFSVWYSADLNREFKFFAPGRLRNIPFLKIFLIVIIWSVMTVVFPYAAAAGTLADQEMLWLTGERMLFLFAITLPFDIRDMEQDMQLGLKTFPVLLGVKRIIVMCLLFLAVFAVSVILRSYFFHHALTPENAAMIISAFMTGVIIAFAGKKRPELYYSGVVESTMIIQLLIVSAAGNIQ
jgi:4-hydroxybenzoate polyprenyltransferase